MITVTTQAAEQIRQAAEHSGADGMSLRVAARYGMEGIEYGMGFDDEAEDDLVFHSEGISLLIGPTSVELLNGVTLDFVELRPGDFQFVFINPNDNGEGPSSCSSSSSGSSCGGCGGGSGCH